MQENFLDLSISGLENWVEQQDECRFRSQQLLQWIYQKGCLDFSKMSNLSKAFRAKLDETFKIQLPEIMHTAVSEDGTIKWTLTTESGMIETVFIPEETRGTLCISSQVGCPVGCKFCATGQQGFQRNLSLGEIIGQVLVARSVLSVMPNNGPNDITNVVFMGMGEPLLNLNPVASTAQILIAPHGLGLARRRVTISTSGVVPALPKLLEHVDVALAVSLHAATDTVRDQLMPINRKYNLSTLIEALKVYYQHSKVAQQGKITLEYTLLKGVNDGLDQAERLTQLFAQLPVKFNLIPWNPIPNTPYQATRISDIEAFQQVLMHSGYIAIIRKTRGRDIAAACGQLIGKIQAPAVS